MKAAFIIELSFVGTQTTAPVFMLPYDFEAAVCVPTNSLLDVIKILSDLPAKIGNRVLLLKPL
jgi:hypothetical protein